MAIELLLHVALLESPLLHCAIVAARKEGEALGEQQRAHGGTDLDCPKESPVLWDQRGWG